MTDDRTISLGKSIKLSLKNWTFPVIVFVLMGIVIPLQILDKVPNEVVSIYAIVLAGLVTIDRNKNGQPDHEKWVIDMMIIIVGIAIGASTIVFALKHDLFIHGNLFQFFGMIGSILTMVGADFLLQANLRTKLRAKAEARRELEEEKAVSSLNYQCDCCGHKP